MKSRGFSLLLILVFPKLPTTKLPLSQAELPKPYTELRFQHVPERERDIYSVMRGKERENLADEAATLRCGMPRLGTGKETRFTVDSRDRHIPDCIYAPFGVLPRYRTNHATSNSRAPGSVFIVLIYKYSWVFTCTSLHSA